MKTKTNLLWGIFFIFIGIAFGLRAFGFWHFSIFFRGWWTLFLIIPCGISILENGFRSGNTIGLIIGLLLFLSQKNIIFPIILIGTGIYLLCKNNSNEKEDNNTYDRNYIEDVTYYSENKN